MNGLSLCSGIGGLDLGLRLVVPSYHTICYVEIEAYPQDVLLARMAEGILDRAPIWDDLKQFDARPWQGLVDLVHGGYPCQPFSVAGKRSGADDPRHLWPDVARVVQEVEPEWCFFENVAGHLTLGFDVVTRDLEAMGYRVAAGLFTAAEVGAPHRRQRLYILARRQQRDGMADPGCVGEHPDESGRSGRPRGAETSVLGSGGASLADTERAEWGQAAEGRREPKRESPDEIPTWPPGPEERDRWAAVLATRPEFAPAVADANGAGRVGTPIHVPIWQPLGAVPDADGAGGGEAEATASPQPAIRRVADGFPYRVDRLKALGNGVVPDVAALAWCTLIRGLI